MIGVRDTKRYGCDEVSAGQGCLRAAAFQRSDDPEGGCGSHATDHERSDRAPDVIGWPLRRASDACFHRSKNKQNDAGDHRRIDERDMCSWDEEVGHEGDDSAEEVAHADRKR